MVQLAPMARFHSRMIEMSIAMLLEDLKTQFEQYKKQCDEKEEECPEHVSKSLTILNDTKLSALEKIKSILVYVNTSVVSRSQKTQDFYDSIKAMINGHLDFAGKMEKSVKDEEDYQERKQGAQGKWFK